MAGFTLIELMIVVAIIGLLAAVAVPAFTKYIRKAKTAEAIEHLEKIGTGARAYYLDERAGAGIAPIAQQFPDNEPLTPGVDCCATADKCTPDITAWETTVWQSLSFAVTDPHYYRYEFVSSGVGVTAEFTARAIGDLDCDGNFGTFERFGKVQNLGSDITLQSGVWKNKELE